MNTNHFKESEFSCKCCGKRKLDVALMVILEDVRRHFNAPVTINSSYRCAKHNAEVGGKPKSLHLSGKAADIIVACVEPSEVYKYLNSCAYSNVIGLGKYNTFTHVDSRGFKARW